MELWDIYDKFRSKKGYIHERGKRFKTGEYHLVVHVWIMNDKGEYLIQKRQAWKHGFPNMWEGSAGGSVIASESSKEAALREVKEEIGIDLEENNLERIFSIKFKHGFDDIWFIKQNIDINDVVLQHEEVAEVKWASIDEIREMYDRGEFIPFKYLDELFKISTSKIQLKIAKLDESEELLELQKQVFTPLFNKYEDYETSPIFEELDSFKERIKNNDYYKILYNDKIIGGVNVRIIESGKMKLRIINILEEYQNKKIGQEVLRRLEIMYPEVDCWELMTILNEERNCSFYEKMGYSQVIKKVVNPKMTLVLYKKEHNILRIEPLV